MTIATVTRRLGYALVLLHLFACGRDAVEASGGRVGSAGPHLPSGVASTPLAPASSTTANGPEAGASPKPSGVPQPDSAQLDVDLEGARFPLAVTFSPKGHLLFATRRGLWDWDPTGEEKTKQLASTSDALFGAQVRLANSESSDHLSVFPPKGTTAEDWLLRATFSPDGAFAAFYAENEAYAQSSSFAREAIAVSVHRTDTGQRVGAWTKTLQVDSTPQYAFIPRLSPSGGFVVIEKALQLEVFETATGRPVLRRSGGSFDDVSTFLNETTLLRSHDRAVDVLDLTTGKAKRSHRSVKGYAVSKDRGRIALLEKGALRVWTLATDTLTPPCKDPRICEYCAVDWVDPSHVRVFETRDSKTEVVCGAEGTEAPALVPHVSSPVFEEEGFRIVEDFAPGAARPSRVTVSMPRIGKSIGLGAGPLEYVASHGRLLIRGDTVRLVDAAGELHELTKSR
jgi:hypothetical protein